MTQPVSPDWEEIRRAFEETDEPLGSIERRTGVHRLSISNRSRVEHWKQRPRPLTPATLDRLARQRPARAPLLSQPGTQQFINRLGKTIQRSLKRLETWLASPAPMSPQDVERFERSMRNMIQNFEKVRMLDVSNNASPSAAGSDGVRSSNGALLTAGSLDAECAELAQRIEQLHASWIARRHHEANVPAPAPQPQASDTALLAAGSPPGATPPATG